MAMAMAVWPSAFGWQKSPVTWKSGLSVRPRWSRGGRIFGQECDGGKRGDSRLGAVAQRMEQQSVAAGPGVEVFCALRYVRSEQVVHAQHDDQHVRARVERGPDVDAFDVEEGFGGTAPLFHAHPTADALAAAAERDERWGGVGLHFT